MRSGCPELATNWVRTEMKLPVSRVGLPGHKRVDQVGVEGHEAVFRLEERARLLQAHSAVRSRSAGRCRDESSTKYAWYRVRP